MIEQILTYDNKKKRMVLVGYYNQEEKLFIKRVNSKHYMIKEQGYGIQEDVIQTLSRKGCKKILIITVTSSFVSNMKDWIYLCSKDFGHGNQRFMPVCKMKKL